MRSAFTRMIQQVNKTTLEANLFCTLTTKKVLDTAVFERYNEITIAIEIQEEEDTNSEKNYNFCYCDGNYCGECNISARGGNTV